MTKAEFRRWVVFWIEKAIKYSAAMCILSIGCVVTALVISAALRALGVA